MMLFVYGTLMSGFGNNRILQEGNAKLVGPATTAARFRMRDVGFPYIKHFKGVGGLVRGEVWDIGDTDNDDAAKATLEQLDQLEGFRANAPRSGHYNRLKFLVRVDGREPELACLYEATDNSWTRAGSANEVKPNDKGILDWSALHPRGNDDED